MSCANCLSIASDIVKSTMVLAGATLYRAIMFMIFLSASIGPSVLFCRLYNKISGLEPMPTLVESAICMMLISCWAEFSVGFEKKICGDVLDEYKIKYPNTMSFGRFSVHFLLYILAYCHLYIQFEFAHSSPSGSVKSEYLLESDEKAEESEVEVATNSEIHTSLFLFVLAYLIFVTSRTFFKDLLNVVGNLQLASFSFLSNFMLRIGFAIVHLLVDFLYFLPCLAIAYTSRGYRTPGNTTYFQLTFTAGLSGMVGALFELNRPWPQRRGRIPCLFYENNMIGKNLLCHALIVLILMMFYRPFKFPKESEAKFDSMNWHVINFSLSVAFTVLHVVKVGAHAVLSQAHELQIDRLDHGDLDIPIDFGDESNHNQNNNAAIQAHSDGGGDGSNEGICARCTANALNNNACSGQGAHPQANLNSNNNNITNISSLPEIRRQKEMYDAEKGNKSELATILEEGEKMLRDELRQIHETIRERTVQVEEEKDEEEKSNDQVKRAEQDQVACSKEQNQTPPEEFS